MTGNPLQAHEASAEMMGSYQQAAIYSMLVIIGVLVLDFRSLTYSLIAALPLAVGVLQTFGLLGFLNIPLNPANLIALPLILGIGVDYGVHIVHEFRECKGPYRMSPGTAVAVLVDALTTIVGFGSLMIATHQGLQSLGRVLTIAVTCCLFSSLVMLPALLAWITRNRPAVPDGRCRARQHGRDRLPAGTAARQAPQPEKRRNRAARRSGPGSLLRLHARRLRAAFNLSNFRMTSSSDTSIESSSAARRLGWLPVPALAASRPLCPSRCPTLVARIEQVGVVTDHLPLAILLAERAGGPDPKRPRPSFGILIAAQLVAFDHGQVVADRHVQIQSARRVRPASSRLARPTLAHLIPTDLDSADRAHVGHVVGVRPDLVHARASPASRALRLV